MSIHFGNASARPRFWGPAAKVRIPKDINLVDVVRFYHADLAGRIEALLRK
jgi:hypothetical protein